MKNNFKLEYKRGDHGFTIVELMIALSILSILLVISTVVLMGLGKMYVKGNNRADIQNTARNIIQDVSSQLQLGGGGVAINSSGKLMCIGSTRYNYVIGRQVGVSAEAITHPNPTKHALWRDTMTNGGSCNPLDGGKMQAELPKDGLTKPGSGVELIPDRMRLTEFTIEPVTNKDGVYRITVGVAYGDDDLLCDRNQDGDCDQANINNPAYQHSQHLQNPVIKDGKTNIGCVGGVGQQFCSTSKLSVTVARRLSE